MILKLEDFLYELPNDRIAKNASKKRDDSKLLFYSKGSISHHKFKDIVNLIPRDSLLIFNNTEVIPARIIMHKESGARIEIFLIEPLSPSKVHEEVMNSSKSCVWKCLIGNAKKWEKGTFLYSPSVGLQVIRKNQNEVGFEWKSSLTFSNILTEIGEIPLPPYIDRILNENDKIRYQTIYSKVKGAVAAPTAGLHFTNTVIDGIINRGTIIDYLTLHVSPGTFQPIKSKNIIDHPMHKEQVWIKRTNLEKIINAKKVIAVGTTSMRAIESLYWYGVKLLNNASEEFFIHKDDPYIYPFIEPKKALEAVLKRMNNLGIEEIRGQTKIFIYPGYNFKICKGLVTNYHLPGSTLILLVASFIGDNWRKVYSEALKKGYQFLSYGDSSLLIP